MLLYLLPKQRPRVDAFLLRAIARVQNSQITNQVRASMQNSPLSAVYVRFHTRYRRLLSGQ